MSTSNEEKQELLGSGGTPNDAQLHYGEGSTIPKAHTSTGVAASMMEQRPPSKSSFAQLDSLSKDFGKVHHRPTSSMPSRSFSVSADGNVSYMTPAEMGKREMYEKLPMTAVSGLQKIERNMSRAFSSYAADIDVLEQEMKGEKKLSEADKISRRSYTSVLLLDELNQDSSVVSTPLITTVLVACLAQFLVGYNIGVMNAPADVVFSGHSTTSWAIAVSAFAAGGPFGANIAGSLAESRGRRGALLLGTWTFLFGGLIQTFALDMFSIIAARFIIGAASGYVQVVVPMYLGEMAPPSLRGTLGTMTQFSVVIGILISDLFAFPFAKDPGWRVLFGVTPATAVILLFLSPFLMESPRWLLGKDKKSRKARFIIKKIRGFRYDHEVETEAGHYIAAFEAHRKDSGDDKKNSSATLKDLASDKSVRILFISSIVVNMAQQLCGINAVFYYSTMFFEGLIDNPLVGTTLVGAVNVLATYLALMLMETCGRRTLILWSSGGMLVCCVIIVLALLHLLPNMAALFGVNLYVTFFEIGLGPIPFLIIAEMFDAKYVAVAMSFSQQTNWASNFVIGLLFPYLVQWLKAFSFAPFAVVLMGTFLFAWFYLPETQGTTPEELQAFLVKKNTSTVYHNMDIEKAYNNPIDMEWKIAMDQLRQEEQDAMKDGSYNYGFQRIES